jgi:small conductance mechanosensitive channel
VLRVGNSSQGEAVVRIDLPLPYDADADAAGAIALREATEIAQQDGFAASVIEPPKLLGIVDVTPGIVTLGLTATIRSGDQDGYLRAVRAAIKSAFDLAVADDPRADYRPPLVTPPAEPG